MSDPLCHPPKAGVGRTRVARVRSEIEKVIDAIVQGVPGLEVKARMAALQDRKDILLKQLESANEPPLLLHPDR